MRDIAYDIIDSAAKVNYDDLPKDVVQITKKFILDFMGYAIAGSSEPACNRAIDLVRDFGGKEESTVLIYGEKVPSPNAAFINGVMAAILAFDATHEEAGLHAFPSVLPAALALAEQRGNVSGKELIVAVAVGLDVACRLGLAVSGPLTLSWALSPTVGCFGATIAAGKILGLDEEKLHHALGIAYSQCAGNWQCVVDRGLVTRLQQAFGGRTAVLSCLLAQRGITGAKNIFEGKHGFFSLYFRGEYDRRKVTEGLGKVFEGKNFSIKLYPCCQFAFGSIDAILSIVQENNIRSDNVAEVVAHVTKITYEDVGKPFEIGESPKVDAQFSIPYTASVAIIRRDVFINDFSVTQIKTDTQVLELAKKVRVIADQEPIGKGLVPCVVDVKARDGKVYSQRVEILKGNPRNPVSIEEVAQKFMKCTAFSSKPISIKNIEKIISAVNHLEDVENVGEIIKLVV